MDKNRKNKLRKEERDWADRYTKKKAIEGSICARTETNSEKRNAIYTSHYRYPLYDIHNFFFWLTGFNGSIAKINRNEKDERKHERFPLPIIPVIRRPCLAFSTIFFCCLLSARPPSFMRFKDDEVALLYLLLCLFFHLISISPLPPPRPLSLFLSSTYILPSLQKKKFQ